MKTEKELASPLPPFIRELRDKIRAGEKTETRRVIAPQPIDDTKGSGHIYWGVRFFDCHRWPEGFERYCRYGSAGDVKYLREPLVCGDVNMKYLNESLVCGVLPIAHYADDNKPVILNGATVKWDWSPSTLPQIFMAKQYARTFVRLVKVKPERLQDIDEAGAILEGISPVHPGEREHQTTPPARDRFQILWDSINGKREGGIYSWKANPWVWAIRFELVK